MAMIKYIDNGGNPHYINQYKINNVNVVNELGDSEFDAISQKVVSCELKQRLKVGYYDEDYITVDCGYKGFIIDSGEY